jgi:uncharacterized protein
MGKTKIMIIALVLILIIIILVFKIFQLLNPTPNSDLSKITLNLNSVTYQIEVARTSTELSAGLSNRPSLCLQCGMIFIFPKPGILPFWMKDTLIPLDMIWLDSAGVIVDIQTAQPQPNTPITQLTLYKNSTPAQYVLELNALDSQKLNLKKGDFINLSPL